MPRNQGDEKGERKEEGEGRKEENVHRAVHCLSISAGARERKGKEPCFGFRGAGENCPKKKKKKEGK